MSSSRTRTRKGPNTALRAAIHQAGVSYGELARELRLTARACGLDTAPHRTRIGHWVGQGEQPRPPWPALLAETLTRLCRRTLTPADLGLSPGPPASAGPSGRGDDTNRRTALGAVLLTPLLTPGPDAARRIDAYTRHAEATDIDDEDADALGAAVHRISSTYSTHAPRQLWHTVAAHRHRAHVLLADRRGTVRQSADLAHHAGMLSVVMAWIAHDLGEHALVAALCRDAWTHGHQARAPEVCAWADDVLATDALYDGRAGDALAAATRGLATAPAGSDAAIRLSAQVARLHARLENREAFGDAAAHARRLHEPLSLQGAHGLFGVDGLRIIAYDASCHGWLGDHRRARDAAVQAVAHFAALPHPAPTRLAIARGDLARAHTALGDLEAALVAARDMINGSRIVQPVRRRAHSLSRQLQRRFPGSAQVADYHEEVRALPS